MKEVKIAVTAKRFVEIWEKMREGPKLCHGIGRFTEEEIANIHEEFNDKLQKIYDEDPYMFLWAAEKFIKEKKPSLEGFFSRDESLYIEKFFDLLSSAKNLKYGNVELENSKKSTFSEIINNQDINGNTYLMKAIERGKEKTAIRLIEFGADVNRKRRNLEQTPLLLAVINDSLSVVRSLIGRANIHAQNSRGETALHLALNGLPDKDSGCYYYIRKISPELYKTKIEIIKLLLKHDRAITPDKAGRTGYHIAREKEVAEIIDIIESKCPFFVGEFKDVDDIPDRPIQSFSYVKESKIEETMYGCSKSSPLKL